MTSQCGKNNIFLKLLNVSQKVTTRNYSSRWRHFPHIFCIELESILKIGILSSRGKNNILLIRKILISPGGSAKVHFRSLGCSSLTGYEQWNGKLLSFKHFQEQIVTRFTRQTSDLRKLAEIIMSNNGGDWRSTAFRQKVILNM